MTIEKERSCDVTEISELVKQIVEGAEEMLDIGAELQFLLPSDSSSSFPELLDTLEGRIFFSFTVSWEMGYFHNLLHISDWTYMYIGSIFMAYTANPLISTEIIYMYVHVHVFIFVTFVVKEVASF